MFLPILKIMNVSDYRLGFIGFGHMAQTICRAIESSRLIPRSQILFVRRDPQKAKASEQEFQITATSLKNLVEKSDILILAVRPNQAEMVLKELSSMEIGSKMLITILAGIKLSFYQKHLGNQVSLLRVMPNVAAAVGEGMNIFTYATNPSVEFKSISHLLFSCMGPVLEVAENLTDISCALAGSGPGFVFKLIEAMARAGEKQGLSYEKALHMASQTFAGAAKLILRGNLPENLLLQIATPHGVTEAGFKAMKALQIGAHMESVIHASAERSREISEEYQ